MSTPQSTRLASARYPLRASLRQNLTALVAIPLVCAMLLSGLVFHASVRADLDAELTTRARIVASALSESAQYDVLRGEKAAARRSMQGVIAADPSIRQITLLDANREPILAFGDVSRDERLGSVEVPVRALAEAEVLSGLGMPTPQGFVRVHVSSSTVERAARLQLLLGWLGLLFAGLAGFVIGWRLLVRLHRPLQSAFDSLRALAYGVGASCGAPADADQLAELDAAIRQVAQNAASAEQRQHERVAVQTRDLQVAVTEAMRADREKQRLLEYGGKLVEEERQRIAVEIHDSLNAELISVRLWAEGIAARARTSNEAEIAQMAHRIVATTNGLYNSTRDIVRQLRPELLDTLGLGGAVEEMVRRLRESQPNCRFDYHAGDSLDTLPASLAMTAYRVVQEALTNIVKHAAAAQVKVCLDRAELPYHIRAVVVDNGKGLAPGRSQPSGLGLIGMRERVAASGGVLSIDSSESGTIVTALL